MSTLNGNNDAIAYAFDPNTGVATLNLAMAGGVNKVDATFARGLADAITWVQSLEGLKGVILGSAHRNFCVGADIPGLLELTEAQQTFDYVQMLNRVYRSLERLPVPVVCALTGVALGGGYELAMACHHRIALQHPKMQVGLPEVGLGVIPGAGGTQRLPRMIGLQKAIEHITLGRPVRLAKALKLGMVDAIADNKEAVIEAAHAWIAAHPGNTQPWDKKGFRYPGPQPDSGEARQLMMAGSAMLYQKTAGNMPHIEAAMSCIQEGTLVAFDAALVIESRYFVQCALAPTARNMIRTMWFHRNAVAKAKGLPVAEDDGVKTLGILGAGMMGAGLAFISASKGITVVVKDISQQALDAGRAHCEAQLNAKRHLDKAAKQAVMDRITFTLELGALSGCDLIIEAVVESDTVKHAVIAETEPLLAEGGFYASNTSAIPITHLAKASKSAAKFIGMHFFSPVEKMPLLEIIRGEHTDDETVGRATKLALRLGKLPVVVNDGYGFFTSRVFTTYLTESVQLVAEGHDPVLVEWAARRSGMVIAPLKVFDEVTLRLGLKAVTQRERYMGQDLRDAAGIKLLQAMVETHGRIGKIAAKGFYDYSTKPRKLWSGLGDLVSAEPQTPDVDYIADRLMLIQVAETVRCLEENIITNKRDAEVAAIFGIGFSPASGGPLAWIDQRGVSETVARLSQLAGEVGERYAPPKMLIAMAQQGQSFWNQ